MKKYSMVKDDFPNSSVYLILFVLNTLTALIYNVCNEFGIMIPIRIGVAVINGMGVTIISGMLLYCIHRFLRINLIPAIIVIIWVIFIVEIFLLFNFYTLITPSVILVILETNRKETSEFIVSYFNLSSCLLLIFLFLVTFLCFHFRDSISKIHLPKRYQNKKVILGFVLIMFVIYVGMTYYITQVRHMTSYQALSGIERVYHSVKNTMRDRVEYKKYVRLVKQVPPVLIENKSRVPYVVVVLGESLSKWHMNAYGYRLATTPKLNRRLQDGETLKFDSVETLYTVTSHAVRNIMTFFDGRVCKKPWYQYHTLPAVMKAAGYQTFWFSNQDSFNSGEDNSTASIASTSSVVKFPHQRHASEERYGYFDGDLLPLLDSQMDSLPSKAFFVFHLMGSHRRYTNRYPSEYDIFGISDIQKDISAEKKRTIAEYDNTVLYNDYVVDEIIKRFENLDAIVFYFPDHGEEVYDTRNMSGHGLDNPTIPMKEIPFTVWTSSLFSKEHFELMDSIRSAVHRPYNTVDFVYTVMDLCGIQTEDYRKSQW